MVCAHALGIACRCQRRASCIMHHDVLSCPAAAA
jgi:hypothetical protein